MREMTAGKGFIALAALIFAKWRPALGACLLFSALDAIGIPLPEHRGPGHRHGAGPVHAGFPYILTVVILAGFVRQGHPRGRRPAYVKER